MPNSQFTSAQREDADTIRLVGPINDVSADTVVHLQVTVTQATGFVAEVDQVIGERDLREKDPPGFEVLARRTSQNKQLDPSAPLRAEGVLTSRVQSTDPEEKFRWHDHLDAEPASGTSSPSWRRRG